MSGLDPTIVIAFFASTILLIATGLFVLAMVLRAQARHRKRLARVGRKRMSGRLDLEDSRLSLLRRKEESNALVSFSNAAARILPLLDTTRLRANILRANMTLSVRGFIVVSLILSAVLACLASLLLGYPLALVILPALLAGMFLLDAFVKLRGNRIASHFMRQLPDALDTIIRGIRSGLPVIECVGTVGMEYDAPIGTYFQSISERVQLGEPLEVALWRVARVIDRPEMDFLAISIAIQMETGGSLAEALGNLGDLLRQRQRMKLKIKAISSEAKASALIIGLLPFMMMGLLAAMSPDYVKPLFTDPRGHMMLAAGLTSIGLGAFVMWRMTQFEI